MIEFLELLAYHFYDYFPTWYYGYKREDLVGLDLLMALICDYFDGDMVINYYEEQYEDPDYDIEYRAWDYNRMGIRETV